MPIDGQSTQYKTPLFFYLINQVEDTPRRGVLVYTDIITYKPNNVNSGRSVLVMT